MGHTLHLQLRHVTFPVGTAFTLLLLLRRLVFCSLFPRLVVTRTTVYHLLLLLPIVGPVTGPHVTLLTAFILLHVIGYTLVLHCWLKNVRHTFTVDVDLHYTPVTHSRHLPDPSCYTFPFTPHPHYTLPRTCYLQHLLIYHYFTGYYIWLRVTFTLFGTTPGSTHAGYGTDVGPHTHAR